MDGFNGIVVFILVEDVMMTKGKFKDGISMLGNNQGDIEGV